MAFNTPTLPDTPNATLQIPAKSHKRSSVGIRLLLGAFYAELSYLPSAPESGYAPSQMGTAKDSRKKIEGQRRVLAKHEEKIKQELAKPHPNRRLIQLNYGRNKSQGFKRA